MRRLRQLVRKWARKRNLLGLAAEISLASLVMMAASSAYASGGGPAHFSDINWWTWDSEKLPLGWFIIDFLVFAFLLVKFLKKPLTNTFQTRHETIKKTIEDNKEAQANAREKHDEFQSKLANVDAEGNALMERSKADGTLEKERIVQDATTYSERIKKDSGSIIEQELNQATLRLQAHAGLSALKDAEERLKSGMTGEDQSRLLEEAIAELEVPMTAGGAA